MDVKYHVLHSEGMTMKRIDVDQHTGTLIEVEMTQDEIDAVVADMLPLNIVVSPRQMRQALNAMNLRNDVETAVATGSQDLKDWWEYATQFEKTHPQVVQMAAELNVSDSTLTDLFVLASTL